MIPEDRETILAAAKIIAERIQYGSHSSCETNLQGEAGNIADGLFDISSAIRYLAAEIKHVNK